MADYLDYLSRLTMASSIEDLWTLHTEEMARFGFDRLMYGQTRFRLGNGRSHMGEPEDLLVLSNHDFVYLERFVHGRMYLNAPMLRWAEANPGHAASWRWIEDNADTLSPEELEVVEFNRSHGLTAGFSISFQSSSSRTRGVISLAGKPGMTQRDVEGIWKENGRIIKIMNDVLHLKICSLPYADDNPLTQRQREALEWIGQGKTIQDIAVILGVKPPTVEKHLRLARDALNVETTAEAVLKASLKGQIFRVADETSAR